MYPLLFKPIVKELIWGSESWDVSCRENEMSIVSNGVFAGERFIDVISRDDQAFLGDRLAGKEFPLFVKIIDACDQLSIQVHPDDDYAREHDSTPYGKNEMWYILDAPAGAELIVGIKEGVSREQFAPFSDKPEVLDFLSRLPVRRGDVVNIPAGLCHALTAGIMVAEVQQNCNTTYRLYDYDRKPPRKLDTAKALDVIDFDNRLRKTVTEGLTVEKDGVSITYYLANKYFAVERHELTRRAGGVAPYVTDGKKFEILTCVEGEGLLESNGTKVALKEATSVFLPAALGEYTVTGACVFLRSYVPDIAEDFVAPLAAAGYSDKKIKELVISPHTTAPLYSYHSTTSL